MPSSRIRRQWTDASPDIRTHLFKEGNEWSNQAEGAPRHHEVFQPRAPQGPPAQTLVGIACLVRLGLTRIRRVESVNPTIAVLVALCPYATFCDNKTVRQLLGCVHFDIYPGTLSLLEKTPLGVLPYCHRVRWPASSFVTK